MRCDARVQGTVLKKAFIFKEVKMKKFARLLGFDPVEKQTSVRTEIMAGIVTFLSMAYILTVNPNSILYAGTADIRWSSLFIATAFGAIIGTLLMAFLAKMPLAQASGMGLNSLVGSIIGGGVGAFAYGISFSIGQAFMMVLISGVIFLLLSVITVKGKTFRELVFDGMPVAVRGAISVGIGLFIAYIGFQNAGIIVHNQYTQVAFVDFTNWGTQTVNAAYPDAAYAAKTAAVALIGLFLIAVLDKLNVKGSVILGILGATVVGIPFGVTNVKVITGTEGISWKFWENFANFFSVGEKSVFGSFTSVFTEGFPAGSLFTVIMLIITMCMIDMFDTMGTIVGCCSGNRILSDENDKPRNYGKIMVCDAVATCAGAALGTSTVTTFVESGAGVSAGGRTGLTAFTTACMFLLAIFAMPLFAMIPSAATASALIYVGVLMMKNNVKNVDFSNAINATTGFLTIVVMVLSYSITKGIGVGMISYTLMSAIAYLVELVKYALTKRNAEKSAEAAEAPKWNVSAVALIVTALFLVYFFVPATLF